MSCAEADLERLENRLGYSFRDRELLLAALTHASAQRKGRARVGERLEFLGDAVLGLVLSELLIARYPEENEGRLSKFRAQLVSTSSFASKARELALDTAKKLHSLEPTLLVAGHGPAVPDPGDAMAAAISRGS